MWILLLLRLKQRMLNQRMPNCVPFFQSKLLRHVVAVELQLSIISILVLRFSIKICRLSPAKSSKNTSNTLVTTTNLRLSGNIYILFDFFPNLYQFYPLSPSLVSCIWLSEECGTHRSFSNYDNQSSHHNRGTINFFTSTKYNACSILSYTIELFLKYIQNSHTGLFGLNYALCTWNLLLASWSKISLICNIQCSKLMVARLPEATKISFWQPVFRLNKGPVVRGCPAFAMRRTWIFFLISSTEYTNSKSYSYYLRITANAIIIEWLLMKSLSQY